MGSWFADRIFVLMAVLFGLVVVALGIAFAGTYSEYAALRDGRHVTGHVTQHEPHQRYVTVTIGFTDRGFPSETQMYPAPAEASAYPVGTPIELLVGGGSVVRATELEKSRPPAALPIGLGLSMVFTVAMVVLSAKLKHRAAPTRTGREVIIEAVARTRNLRLAGAVLLAPLAVAFSLVPLADTSADRGSVIGIEVLALVTLGTAVVLGWVAFRLRNPAQSPVLALIEQSPKEIGWAYVQTETRRGITMYSVVIKTRAGKTETMVLPEGDAQTVMAELKARAPAAVYGYSRENEQRFKQSLAA